jgi:hypothetical protein
MRGFKIHIKFSLIIVIAFIVFTAVGTISHELGHIALARGFGYETVLHYGSMAYNYKGFNEDQVLLGKSVIIEKEQDKITKEMQTLWITLGGPIQTILTSIIGLLILWYRKSKDKFSFKLLDWIGVFLSLFILRDVFNFVMASYKYLFFNRSSFHGDEFRISRYLGFNEWLIPSITLLIGIVISIYIIFKVIPFRYRFSFIISGLAGGILGFSLWFGFLGSLFLP